MALPTGALADSNNLSAPATSTGVLTPACQLPPGQAAHAVAEFRAGRSAAAICAEHGNKPFGTYGGPTGPTGPASDTLAGVHGTVDAALPRARAAQVYPEICGTQYLTEADLGGGWALFEYGLNGYWWWGPFNYLAYSGQWNRNGWVGVWSDGGFFNRLTYAWASADAEHTGAGWVSSRTSVYAVNDFGDACTGAAYSVNYIH